MTTDITELAQHMKAAAVLAKKYRSLTLTVSVEETLALVEALEYYKSREERVTSLVRDNSKSWDELYRQVEAKGKRNVELVEALESEKRICATWRKTAESTGEKLEKAQTKIIELQQKCEIDPRTHEIIDLKERIENLESRTVTVKLPPCVDDLHGIGMVMSADAVIEMLAAAGIKLEAE